MELKDLVGEHVLTHAAVFSQSETVRDSDGDPVNCVAFGLDGGTYIVYEDPSDGYRSYVGAIEKHEGATSALEGSPEIFEQVYVSWLDDEYWEVLEFRSSYDGHLWLQIGTGNCSDYYPFCVMQWNAKAPS